MGMSRVGVSGALATGDGSVGISPGLMMSSGATETMCLKTGRVEAKVGGMFKDDGNLKCIKETCERCIALDRRFVAVFQVIN